MFENKISTFELKSHIWICIFIGTLVLGTVKTYKSNGVFRIITKSNTV